MSDKVYVPYMTNQEAAEILLRYFPAVPNAKVRYAAAMGVEALKKQAGIEKALERLEKMQRDIYSERQEFVQGMNGSGITYNDGEIYTITKAIEIIKEEIGYGETET